MVLEVQFFIYKLYNYWDNIYFLTIYFPITYIIFKTYFSFKYSCKCYTVLFVKHEKNTE